MRRKPASRLDHGMRNSRILLASAILLAALLAAWYFLSPFLLLRSLSTAVKNDDRDAIATDVDFPAVRDGLKQQLDSYIETRVAGPRKRDPFARLLLSLAPSIGGQVIDAVVTPDGVATILRQHTSQTSSGGTSRPSLWRGKFAWIGPDHRTGSGAPGPVRMAGHRTDPADEGTGGALTGWLATATPAAPLVAESAGRPFRGSSARSEAIPP